MFIQHFLSAKVNLNKTRRIAIEDKFQPIETRRISSARPPNSDYTIFPKKAYIYLPNLTEFFRTLTKALRTFTESVTPFAQCGNYAKTWKF